MCPQEQHETDDRVSAGFSDGGEWSITLKGSWTLEQAVPHVGSFEPEDWGSVRRIGLRDGGLGPWDSGLVAFLVAVADLAEAHGVEVDSSGLPSGANGLLALARKVPERAGASREAQVPGFLERAGRGTLAALAQTRAVLAFVGELVLALGRLLTGRARFRRADLVLFIQQSGVEALPIVSLISLLVGVILAFVGAVQLAMFGAQVYIANAVGIGMLRQMGAMMTAIIMAGRTGAAFAAQLGSMQVNEEIDAFKTLGISPMDFLVLPRLLALVLMVPLLTIYADVLGILGGMLVGVGMFDITVTQYLSQTLESVTLVHLAVGLFMSLVFAVIIAVAGCYQGVNSGRSSAAVGEAATTAVVSAIVGIVVADAVITLVATQLGI